VHSYLLIDGVHGVLRDTGRALPRRYSLRAVTGMANEAKMANKAIYTTHEVARLLHVSPRAVINWIGQNLLPSYRTPGGHRRIRREDLLVFVRKHQIPTPASLVQGKFIVLIVDDDQNIVEPIRTFLLRQGSYQVASASDGISALIEVGRIEPDLLILDLKIPGVDGIEVCRRIKSDSANRTSIIAVSGSPEYRDTSLQSGADAFMLKPVELERLHAEIKRLLGVL
jgi:excisionase family DNA binding protein